MELYDLERQFKHQFYYVKRVKGTFDYRTGDQSTRGVPVLCRGVAFSSKDARFKDTIARVRGIVEQPFNDWVFLLRSHWVSDLDHSSFFVYEGIQYEILDIGSAEGGYIVTCRTTNKPFTIIHETMTVELEDTTEVTDA